VNKGSYVVDRYSAKNLTLSQAPSRLGFGAMKELFHSITKPFVRAATTWLIPGR
jgi:hypothetical protein